MAATVARRKIIDSARRRHTSEAAAGQLQFLAKEWDSASTDAEIPDRRLALLFACAHPAIEAGIRAPLMLQVVLGLDAKTIASAFLMSPAAMAKRLGRAKTKIREAGVPFRIPERDELPGRLDAVLEAIYATFAEGGPILAAPMSSAAISPKKPSFSPDSWPALCRSRRRLASSHSCCTPKPAVPRGAMATASTFRLPSRIRPCGKSK